MKKENEFNVEEIKEMFPTIDENYIEVVVDGFENDKDLSIPYDDSY